jgi:dihydrofolate reductase
MARLLSENGTQAGSGAATEALHRPDRVMCSITMSVDGFVAGPRQRLENPLSERGELLHRWMFEQPEVNAAEIRAQTSAGAFVMGRNMFTSGRGEWDPAWRC